MSLEALYKVLGLYSGFTHASYSYLIVLQYGHLMLIPENWQKQPHPNSSEADLRAAK